MKNSQEPTDTSKQPIRTRYLGHVIGYQPIRDQYFPASVGKTNEQRTELEAARSGRGGRSFAVRALAREPCGQSIGLTDFSCIPRKRLYLELELGDNRSSLQEPTESENTGP
eukprot:sb/3477104/